MSFLKQELLTNDCLSKFNYGPPSFCSVLTRGNEYQVFFTSIPQKGNGFYFFKFTENFDSDQQLRHMEEYYLYNNMANNDKITRALCPLELVVGKDREGKMHRGRFLGQNGAVSLIHSFDEGITRKINTGFLYKMRKEYEKIPWQSFVGFMSGLEIFTRTKVLQAIESEVFFESADETYELGVKAIGYSPHYSNPVLLVKNNMTGEIINDLIIDSCIDKLFTVLNKIPKLVKGAIFKGYIPHFANDGLIGIHVQTDESAEDSPFVVMENYLGNYDLNKLKAELGPVSYEQIKDSNDMFVAVYSADGSLYRVKITGISQSMDKAEVMFIDYGNIETVPFDSIFPASALDPVLTRIPPLAIMGRLKWVSQILNRNKVEDILKEDHLFTIEVKNGAEAVGDLNISVVCVYTTEDLADRNNVNKNIVIRGFAKK